MYTQTVCGQCMLAKMWINNAGKQEDIKLINLDHESDSLRDSLREAGFQSLPILEVEEGNFVGDMKEIQRIIES